MINGNQQPVKLNQIQISPKLNIVNHNSETKGQKLVSSQISPNLCPFFFKHQGNQQVLVCNIAVTVNLQTMTRP